MACFISSPPALAPSVMRTSLRSHRAPVASRAPLAFPQLPNIFKPKRAQQVSVQRHASRLPHFHIGLVAKPSLPLWLVALFAAAAVAWLLRRWLALKHLSNKYVRTNLNADIAHFYDVRSAAWETVWGEHLHHGLYDVVNRRRMSAQHAQIRTMSELLKFGRALDLQLPAHANILDLGCGIGGASRFLARHFAPSCRVTGITLSAYQARRANELNRQKGLAASVTNEVRDALNSAFDDEHFHIIWSLESAEHIHNKQRLMSECARMLKPGGRLLMLAWCVRECTPSFSLSERYAIRRIMDEYCLPSLSPPSEYHTEMLRAGFRDIAIDDWTHRAAPFWAEVLRSAFFNPLGWKMLFKYKWPLLRSALAIRHVTSGIRQGVFRLVAFSATKPTEQQMHQEAQRVGTLPCRERSDLP
eukprot:TRINITY_DN227_c0_g1_i2.p2 TRINITY_DN227_c0_g1~~TRINITY_DN227_c0_g1_i2.p2  ORF type:complete len:415 (+),score=99.77 TRINITY_DN227_c0_g1_i2:775-2019(+)